MLAMKHLMRREHSFKNTFTENGNFGSRVIPNGGKCSRKPIGYTNAIQTFLTQCYWREGRRPHVPISRAVTEDRFICAQNGENGIVQEQSNCDYNGYFLTSTSIF